MIQYIRVGVLLNHKIGWIEMQTKNFFSSDAYLPHVVDRWFTRAHFKTWFKPPRIWILAKSMEDLGAGPARVV